MKLRLSLPLLFLVALPSTAARADTVIIDQSNTAPVNVGSGLPALSPFGQEFTPTLTSLNFVDLRTAEAPLTGGSVGVTLRVNIRFGSITGAIVGTSAELVLPDNFGTSGPFGGAVTSFSFTTPVTLTPGSLYVIELVHVAGGEWAVYSSSGNPYAGGRAIFSGDPAPHNEDLYFVEGLRVADAAVPEPMTMLLLGTGLTGAVVAARRRRGRDS